MAESAAAWQAKQKDKAVNTQVKRPDIPGDYGGHITPPVPATKIEGFIGSNGVAWPALIGGATLLLLAIAGGYSLRQRLK